MRTRREDVLSGDTVRPYLTEGVGEDFIPATFDPALVDRWVAFSDRDAFEAARRLTREEGILAGESCGTALVAALQVGRELAASPGGRDAVMVVLLPDSGRNYLSKLYSDEWMRQRGMLPTAGATVPVDALLRKRPPGAGLPPLVIARTTDTVGEAIERLQAFGISQMPVSEASGDSIGGMVGSISEKGLLERALRDPGLIERTVGEIMDEPLPAVARTAALDEAFGLLSAGATAVLAESGGHAVGVITKLDVLEFIARRAREA